MKIIDTLLLDSLCEQATANPRLRINHNFHESLHDPVNRLLNAMQPGTYVIPHRHSNPAKEEIFLVLRGKILFLIFDEQGNISKSLVMSPQSGVYGMEIEAGVWHSLIVLEPDTVIYEIKRGPYAPLSKEDIAPWAPDSSDLELVAEYIDTLLEQLN